MKMHRLTCLVAAADLGSVRMAAQQLGRSPTAISNALRELEREMGTVLFDRTPDGVLLNEAGKALATHARLIMRHLQQAQDELAEIKGRTGGQLAVACSPWLVVPLVGPALRQFQKQRPDIKISIGEHLGDRYQLLRDGGVDIAFGPAPAADQLHLFDVTPLFSYDCAVLARTGHPAEHASSWAELAPYDWLVTNDFMGLPPVLQTAIDADAEHGLQRVHQASSMFCLLSMLRSTDMLSIVPWPLLEVPGIRVSFSALQLNHPHSTTTCMVMRKDDVPSTVAMTFLACFDELRDQLAESTNPVARRIAALIDAIDINP